MSVQNRRKHWIALHGSFQIAYGELKHGLERGVNHGTLDELETEKLDDAMNPLDARLMQRESIALNNALEVEMISG